MYLPAAFEEKRPEVLQALVRDRPLGLLVTQSADGELAADNVPFLLDPDAGGGPGILRAHVARANPLWRTARGDVDSLIVFQGPQAYVSPSMYPAKAETGKVVPTWNYVTVQARGRIRAIHDPAWLRALLDRLTERHESPRPAPWSVNDAPAEFIGTLVQAIVGIEFELTSLTGKWKVSQNRPAPDRDGVARDLHARGDDEAAAMAGWVEGRSAP